MTGTEHPSAGGDNAFSQFFQNDCTANPHMTEGWAAVRALLSERAHTVDELIAATGLHRRMVKGFVYWGRKAGRVRAVDTPRREEVTPDLTLVRNVRAYRLAQQDTTKGTQQ